MDGDKPVAASDVYSFAMVRLMGRVIRTRLHTTDSWGSKEAAGLRSTALCFLVLLILAGAVRAAHLAPALELC